MLAPALLDSSWEWPYPFVWAGAATGCNAADRAHPGVRIRESNLDDDIEIQRDASITRSQIRDGAIVGPGAHLSEAVVGSMSEVRSEPFNPTTVEDCVALGDEVIVYPGVHLATDVSVFPRLKLPSGIRVPPGVEVAGPADVLRYL